MLSARQMGAKVQTLQALWRVKTSREITVGPEPRLVLSVRARRDVELLHVLVTFPALLMQAGGHAETVMARVPHAQGLRRLRPENEPYVWGQEDVRALAMLDGDRPEDLASAPEQVRWHGDTVAVLEHNLCRAPCDYWCWRGRASIPKGLSVGFVVRSSRPMPCRVQASGV